MATKKVVFNKVSKVVNVLDEATATPAGSVLIGSFTHPSESDPLGPEENHVIWHHVRDMLYHQGEFNMQIIKIMVAGKVLPLSITVAPTTVSVRAESTAQLTPTVLPVDATDKSVTYTSNDLAIAKVSETGLITGVKAGSTTISTKTVSDPKITTTTTVNVTHIPMTDFVVTINVNPNNFTVGSKGTLGFTPVPTNATGGTITYRSLDPLIATIDPVTGVITGVKAGETEVQALLNGTLPHGIDITVK